MFLKSNNDKELQGKIKHAENNYKEKGRHHTLITIHGKKTQLDLAMKKG